MNMNMKMNLDLDLGFVFVWILIWIWVWIWIWIWILDLDLDLDRTKDQICDRVANVSLFEYHIFQGLLSTSDIFECPVFPRFCECHVFSRAPR